MKVAGCGLRVAFSGMACPDRCYMHDVTPNVVAMAVRMVMAMWMIFFQISCLSMVVELKINKHDCV